MWEILNANMYKWDGKTYPTREDAEKALRALFKGLSGVRFERFTIRRIGVPERTERHYDSQGYCDNPGRGY